eukprot:68341-Chlamydomonas_euryale.AAC.5
MRAGASRAAAEAGGAPPLLGLLWQALVHETLAAAGLLCRGSPSARCRCTWLRAGPRQEAVAAAGWAAVATPRLGRVHTVAKGKEQLG